ncbi:unnamed protein product [Caenorhabditis auriculariae]|uniref:C-type lectin domain-containing protein n=1 Tax=Caenorhabditis auriculariae TaxID=2777116 RepID=A0A8S1GT80_9PELO|nr:unnamed protein product [Caenorhabditis auriculariae]
MKVLLSILVLFAGEKVLGQTQSPDPTCNCKLETVWNDVIFAFDRSSATTDQGLQELLFHVQTDIEWFTLCKGDAQDASCQSKMRAGIILYNSQATVQNQLGSLDSDDFMGITSLPFDSADAGTNLEAAIKTAKAEFDQRGRANARKVLVVLATTYKPGDYEDPTQMANTFKEDGGILVVYNYVEQHGAPAAGLKLIASNGYFCNSTEDTSGDCLRQAQCDANCFCPPNYNPYDSVGTRLLPMGGCYYTIPLSAAQKLASNRCKSFNSGTLPYVESADKFKYLIDQFPSGANFWIGLTYNTSTTKWQWPDNSALATDGYAPWAKNEPSNPASKGCAYSPITTSSTSGTWATADCRQGYSYVCESSPMTKKIPIFLFLLFNFSSAGQIGKCQCDPHSVWADVMFLFETTSTMTYPVVQQLFALVQSDMDEFHIVAEGDPAFDPPNKTVENTTRIGIISYNTNATLLYPLASLNNQKLSDIQSFPYFAGDSAEASLESAMDLAFDELFDEKKGRPHVRKVLVIFATSYRTMMGEDPKQLASSFKLDGGIVIVYDFVRNIVSQDLKAIASKGFFNTSQDSDEDWPDFLQQALCDANCICPPNYASFETNDWRPVPGDECFYASYITANYKLSARKCSEFHSGILPVIDSQAKSDFLASETSNRPFWTGLTYDNTTNLFYWSDGTNVTESQLKAKFAPWDGNGEPDISSGNRCVAQLSNGKWSLENCLEGSAAICEVPPCDSVNYCPL